MTKFQSTYPSVALALCALVATGGRSGAARATTVLAMTLQEVVDAADLVVYGTVVDHKTSWRHGKVTTTCVLEVEEVVQGNKEDKRVMLVLQGGEYGNVGLKVIGEPSCGHRGDKLIVAAKKLHLQKAYRPIGVAQGWFPVRGQKGRERYVVPPATDLNIVSRPSSTGKLLPASGPLMTKLPLRSFLDQLKHMAEGRRSGGRERPSPRKSHSPKKQAE